MPIQTSFEPVDYLVIGHFTQDLTPSGTTLGGTAAYAALTAASMGLKVGVLTACPVDLDFTAMGSIQIAVQPDSRATTFENIRTPDGRVQIIHHIAKPIQLESVPSVWLSTPIIHIGPMAQEIPSAFVDLFPDSKIGITPQGMMRQWDETGRVSPCEWIDAEKMLPKTSAVVISVEDVAGDEGTIARFNDFSKVLVVTEANQGARLYSEGGMRHFDPPVLEEIDATGAGDIFSAVFFSHFFQTGNLDAAARFATLAAAHSIEQPGLKGVPQPSALHQYLAQINENK